MLFVFVLPLERYALVNFCSQERGIFFIGQKSPSFSFVSGFEILAILVFLTYFDFVIFAVSYWWPTGLALQFLLQVLKWEAWTSEILLVQRQELEETYAVQHKNLDRKHF